jgi:hypothetical protein
MKVSILQPHYFPYVGYFNLIKRSDIFVFLDDVDYIKREWKNRNKIRLNNSSTETSWISIPISKIYHKNFKIINVKLNKQDLVEAQNQQINKLKNSYLKSPYFDQMMGIFKLNMEMEYNNLSELNINTIQSFFKLLKINTKIYKSSELNVTGKKNEKILNICKKLGASIYLANNKSKNYLEENKFLKQNITIEYQNFSHPIYEQYYDKKKLIFTSNLSILDLVANQGLNSFKYI